MSIEFVIAKRQLLYASNCILAIHELSPNPLFILKTAIAFYLHSQTYPLRFPTLQFRIKLRAVTHYTEVIHPRRTDEANVGVSAPVWRSRAIPPNLILEALTKH